MKVIDVYKQYFEAQGIFNGVERKGVVATLTATSDAGTIRYVVGLSFFPHVAEDDFAITYDAYGEKELYFGKGRRSKKREAVLMEDFGKIADELAESLQAKVYWNKPLCEAVRD